MKNKKFLFILVPVIVLLIAAFFIFVFPLLLRNGEGDESESASYSESVKDSESESESESVDKAAEWAKIFSSDNFKNATMSISLLGSIASFDMNEGICRSARKLNGEVTSADTSYLVNENGTCYYINYNVNTKAWEKTPNGNSYEDALISFLGLSQYVGIGESVTYDEAKDRYYYTPDGGTTTEFYVVGGHIISIRTLAALSCDMDFTYNSTETVTLPDGVQ